jgi:hypothetical protein
MPRPLQYYFAGVVGTKRVKVLANLTVLHFSHESACTCVNHVNVGAFVW